MLPAGILPSALAMRIRHVSSQDNANGDEIVQRIGKPSLHALAAAGAS
jgi:hypothetical protein